MSNSIIQVEDFIIDKARGILGPNIGTTEALPSAVNITVIKQLIASNKTPGIYPIFLGGKTATGSRINASFDVLVIVKHAGNFTARRRGDSTIRGAYLFLAALVKRLDNKTVKGIGTLKLSGIKNLFAMAVEENFNAALYAISFQVPNMEITDDDAIEDAQLADFLLFHSEQTVEGDGAPVATDEVTLDQ